MVKPLLPLGFDNFVAPLERLFTNPIVFGGVSHAVFCNGYIFRMASVSLRTLHLRRRIFHWASLVVAGARGQIYGCFLGSGLV